MEGRKGEMMILIEQRTCLVCPERKKGVRTVKKNSGRRCKDSCKDSLSNGGGLSAKVPSKSRSRYHVAAAAVSTVFGEF